MCLGPVVRARVFGSWFLGLVLALSACGDDDDAAPDAGAGAGESGTAASSGRGGNSSMIPRPDAHVMVEDPVPPCLLADPNGCKPGEVCDLVIRRAPGETRYTYYTGCIRAERQRAAGDPCDPDLTNGTPYTAPGLTDEVFYDSCGPSLTCAPNRAVRGAGSCQTLCSTERGNGLPCEDENTTCFPATEISEYCRKNDNCDVGRQTGCVEGEACYLALNDYGTNYLALCSTPLQMPNADGTSSCAFLSCAAGSVCMGPVHLPLTRWTIEDLKCRPVCGPNSRTDGDAGVEDSDGGVPRGSCSAQTQCEPYAESGISLKSLKTPPYGQCEP